MTSTASNPAEMDTLDPHVYDWYWAKPRAGEHFRTCSYCGSIHPDDLVASEIGGPVDWADMKYGWPHKFYVHVVNQNPEQLFVVASCTSPHLPYEGWVRAKDIPRGVVKSGWLDSDEWYMVDTRRYHFAKFYSVHLRDPRVAPETVRAIEQLSGLHFEFDVDGGIRWYAAPREGVAV